MLFGAFGFVVWNDQICLFHRSLHVSFLGDFWHAVRTHVCVKFFKKNRFFDFVCIFFNFFLKWEHMSLGAEFMSKLGSLFSCIYHRI
jgi:hypothetical protein